MNNAINKESKFPVPSGNKKSKKREFAEEILESSTKFNRRDKRLLEPLLEKITPSLIEFFKELPDKRKKPWVKYPYWYLIGITVLGYLAGFVHCQNTLDFLNDRLELLEALIPEVKEYGLPCEATLCNALADIDCEAMRNCFKKWINSIYHAGYLSKDPNQLSIDGTKPKAAKNTVKGILSQYIQNMIDVNFNLILDLVEVDKKSNEKIATKDLLIKTGYTGVYITTDAMNSTQPVMSITHENGQDFVFPIKGEHKELQQIAEDNLLNTILKYKAYLESKNWDLEDDIFLDFCRDEDNKRRHEIREVAVCNELRDLDREKYPYVEAFGVVKRTVTECKIITKEVEDENGKKRKVRNREVVTTTNVVFFVLSKIMSAEDFMKVTRKHWAIESFHWIKDNYLLEDRSTNYKGNARYNLAVIRRIVFNIYSLLEMMLKEIDQESTFIRKRSFLEYHLGVCAELVFGHDPERYSVRLAQFYAEKARVLSEMPDIEPEILTL